MKGETGERWRKLCEQAAIEQDPLKLMRLVTEINRLLLEKEERLVHQGERKPRRGMLIDVSQPQSPHSFLTAAVLRRGRAIHRGI